MSRFLVGSALFAVAMLAIFGTGTTNSVVSWFDNLGNPSQGEITDDGIAIAADLTPIQKAGSYVQPQTTPVGAPSQQVLFGDSELGQGGAPPNAADQSTPQTPATTPAAVTDTSIPALW